MCTAFVWLPALSNGVPSLGTVSQLRWGSCGGRFGPEEGRRVQETGDAASLQSRQSHSGSSSD
ncbi:MAG: hypothetical protein K6E86_09170 [Bacteroidales bacterium]|nr:hypothetical protein [Bacteroidales bacterium]